VRDTPRPDPTRDLDTPDEIAEMARVDWSEHLPKLAAFWCRALLGMPGYEGNPFRAHQLVHSQRSFTTAHFERWLTLFHETLELGWTGPNVRRALDLADNVARVHSHQLLGHAVTIGPNAST
jgi:hemoglobin